jgi:hypothetical protein
VESFRALAESAGWRPVACWTDENDWFAVHALKLVDRLRRVHSALIRARCRNGRSVLLSKGLAGTLRALAMLRDARLRALPQHEVSDAHIAMSILAHAYFERVPVTAEC